MNKVIDILVFEEADLLDIFGPMEIFILAGYECTLRTIDDSKYTNLYDQVNVCAEKFCFDNTADLLLIPGGPGIEKFLEDENKVYKLKHILKFNKYKSISTICTGALILYAANIESYKNLCTHWLSEMCFVEFDEVNIIKKRFHFDINNYSCSSGITSGIDLALKIVEEWEGDEKRREIELMIEYKMSNLSFRSTFSSSIYSKAKKNIQNKYFGMIERRSKLLKKYRRNE